MQPTEQREMDFANIRDQRGILQETAHGWVTSALSPEILNPGLESTGLVFISVAV